jgi:hypothetical protein
MLFQSAKIDIAGLHHCRRVLVIDQGTAPPHGGGMSALVRPSTSFFLADPPRKVWMPATSAGMTTENKCRRKDDSINR